MPLRSCLPQRGIAGDPSRSLPCWVLSDSLYIADPPSLNRFRVKYRQRRGIDLPAVVPGLGATVALPAFGHSQDLRRDEAQSACISPKGSRLSIENLARRRDPVAYRYIGLRRFDRRCPMLGNGRLNAKMDKVSKNRGSPLGCCSLFPVRSEKESSRPRNCTLML